MIAVVRLVQTYCKLNIAKIKKFGYQTADNPNYAVLGKIVSLLLILLTLFNLTQRDNSVR